MNIKAKGVKGFIIRGVDDYWFRVYDKDHNFKDYEIWHHDLAITIDDDDAVLYEREHDDVGILDYDFSEITND